MAFDINKLLDMLGGVSNQGGMLSDQDMNKARMQGIGGLAQSLLASSGYSQTPTSFGQALGQGLGNAQQLSRQAQQDAIQQKVLMAQLQSQKDEANRRKKSDLVAVIGKDGKPQYIPAEMASGMQPFSMTSEAKDPAVIQEYNLAKTQGYAGNYMDFLRDRSASNVGAVFSPAEVAGAKGAFSRVTGQFSPTSSLSQEADAERQRVLAGAEGKNIAENQQAAATNAKAFSAYQASMGGLTEALEGTATGPIIGRAPAFTASQQTADKAVAAMAPTLKSLFRTAGEGTFTDKDQELLLNMIPGRKDSQEARAFAVKNIDAIVRAKLGQGSFDDYFKSLPSGSEFIGPDGRKRIKP